MSDFNVHNDAQDISWYTSPSPVAGTGYTAAGGGYTPPPATLDSFEEEMPLLEELGIDIPGIVKKSKAMLFFQLGSPDLEDLDMGGPLLLAAALGAIHLVMGKLHFGVILGWSVVAACLLAFVVNQLAGDGNPDSDKLVLYSVCCLLGYCLIPILLLSISVLVIPGKHAVHYSVAVMCVAWSTYLAASLFVRRSICLEDVRALIAYPCFLVYTTFALLAVYYTMRRIVKMLSAFTALVSVWVAAAGCASDAIRLAVLLAPLLGLVLFGGYMLCLLVLGVLTFKTVPEEAELLMKDISEAREDLTRRGVLDS